MNSLKIQADGSNREAFCRWYKTPIGQMLQQIEARYLSRNINVSYKQLILQLGSLGWEDAFLDEGRYENFFIVDTNTASHGNMRKVVGNTGELPIATESIDLIIMPHILEFEPNQHQLLREVERVLKPEGQLLLLGFNPWSVYRLYHVVTGKRETPPWCGKFVSRYKVLDWLHLLNFATDVTAGFYLKPSSSISEYFEKKHSALFVIAYAIKAIKRRYTLIPLKPVWITRPGFITAEASETSTCSNIHG